jgi:hypothetical protein
MLILMVVSKTNSNKENAYLFLLNHDRFVWKRSLVCILEPWLIIRNYKFHKCTHNPMAIKWIRTHLKNEKMKK